MRIGGLPLVALLVLVSSPRGIAQQGPAPLDPLPAPRVISEILLTGGSDDNEWLPSQVLMQRPDVSERYVSVFREALRDGNVRAKYRALTTLSVGGYAQRELAYREGGIEEVARALRPLRTLRPVLLQLLEDPDVYVREGTAGVVANLLPPSPEVLGALMARLEDEESKVRVALLESLIYFGPCIREQVVEDVLRAAKSPMATESGSVAGAALFALGWLHTDADRLHPGVAEAFRQGLSDERQYVRQESLDGVAEAGVAAAPVREAVARVAGNAEEVDLLRRKAQSALVSIRGERRGRTGYGFQNRCDDPALR